ncbi:hypothetical protein QTP86_016662, partial [Hemibagrus guttatus]
MTAEKHDLFEDPSFTADDSALFSDYTTPLSRLTGKVTWLRPEQISKSPCLFPDDYADAYPKQGILGDCWLLCACTMLLKNRYLLNQVMPPGQCVWGQSGYTGQFRFQFWRNGHWTEIQIDDRLPCIKDTPCFSRCQSPMAFWVALLEKAYAKLHGSYERLWAGQVCEAVVDLSGGVAERWSLKKSLNTPGGRSVFSELSQEMRKQSYISCCVHEAPTGAPEQGQFHALSVMEWKAVKTIAGAQVQLLQIHNPWGRRCWEGAWTERFLCYPNFRSLLTHTQQISGSWVRGQSAGGCRNNSTYSSNPKFWLKVKEQGEVLMSLLQHGPWSSVYNSQKRQSHGNTHQHPYYQAIALHVWKVDKKRFNLTQTLNSTPCASSRTHTYEREVVVHAHLSAGFYLLVPSTFLQGAQGHFLLRVHSTCPNYLSAVKVSVQQKSVGGEWKMASVSGCWTVGTTAGGGRNFPSHGQNPHVPLIVTYDPGGTNVSVTLRQHSPENTLHAIGFHIYKVIGEADCMVISGTVCPVVSCVPHAHSQEVSVQCRLASADYVILPSTYQPDCSAEYTLTIMQKIPRLTDEIRQAPPPWTVMIVICSESREEVEMSLERWRSALERRGMKVCRDKTEYMQVNEREDSKMVQLKGAEVRKVDEFKYLGSAVQGNGECGREVKKRVQA